MRFPKKTTAAALAGAVGLASAAYGVGSATGGGSAVAESSSGQSGSGQRDRPPGGPHDRGPGDPGPALDNFADALGVDAEELQDALKDFHDQHRADNRAAFAATLGKALGKSAADVEAAFDGLFEKRDGRFAGRLADELGLDADKVASALGELRDEKPRDPGSFAAALADKLGMDSDKVDDALRAIRPDGRARHHRHGALPLRQLATALDVTRAELRKAFRDLREGADSAAKDRRAELVAFLAERFGISKEKVDGALPQFPGPGPGRHGGRPGAGGPGGPGGPGFGPGVGPPPGVPG
jgi:hypothetical protein